MTNTRVRRDQPLDRLVTQLTDTPEPLFVIYHERFVLFDGSGLASIPWCEGEVQFVPLSDAEARRELIYLGYSVVQAEEALAIARGRFGQRHAL
jgi:hypothetical protein